MNSFFQESETKNVGGKCLFWGKVNFILHKESTFGRHQPAVN